MTYNMPAVYHISTLLTAYSSSLYELRVLRDHGLPANSLQDVLRNRIGARRRGHEGALASPLKCCKVFLRNSGYSKTLSRRIIYALFL